MNFNEHSNMEGKHAFLGASRYHWINYDEDKLVSAYQSYMATQKGTLYHDFAARCITLGEKLRTAKKTLNMYVNDAIGFKMTPEQVLYFSENCFGTADAIVFRDGVLRIHDLKAGSTPAHFEQLLIYAALFCLEYGKDPSKIETELRIYQSNDIRTYIPTPDEIAAVSEKIISFDKLIKKMKAEEI